MPAVHRALFERSTVRRYGPFVEPIQPAPVVVGGSRWLLGEQQTLPRLRFRSTNDRDETVEGRSPLGLAEDAV